MILDTQRAFQGNAIWGQCRWYLLVLARYTMNCA